jgi:hypothetical protein
VVSELAPLLQTASSSSSSSTVANVGV